MFHVALFEPEIPPNTGNIIRLCANTNTQLHLIHPLGFQLNEKNLRRAALDYQEWAKIKEYSDWENFISKMGLSERLFAFTTKGKTNYAKITYQVDDILLFGPETRGLPPSLLETLCPSQQLYIPMKKPSRSLNLSNAVAIAVYEAWRQTHFKT